ncbi:MAG: hypothetical protein GWN76_08295, partial [candidate division Zixibacteria bacterium]|nr:hypothetical protein [candidate division Zixibacteria bacterium]NIR63946.1 hypothetical protein [candidate division Zixibacteria bacterium]NIU13999.1 hypothetical protein [candidate division Zixibacteria bacterium]NIW44831.1 hypothetical protein [Gammaproteobacteria bacterium]
NTATWEASTDEGYGQSPQDNLLAPFAFLAYEDSSTDTAVVEFVEATHSAYLPVIYHSFPPTIPVQISPENGAVLDTLIPDLVIDGGENPPYDIIRVYLGTSRYTMTPIHHLQSTADTLVLNSNLEPATEYFWRLCFVDDVDGADLQCSLIWSFTTGSGGIIPGIPTLSSPEDGATGIELDNISVSWEAVDNALLYEVFLHPQGDEFNYLIIT